MRVLDCLRMEHRPLRAAEIAALLQDTTPNIRRCLNGMEGYGAVEVDRTTRPYMYKITNAGYVLRGSFPPKEGNT